MEVILRIVTINHNNEDGEIFERGLDKKIYLQNL